MSEEAYRRRTARVLLADGTGRFLFFRFRGDHRRNGQGHCWITPGGGVDDGETLREAAARELFEEAGLRVAPGDFGAPVAVTSGQADLGWARGRFRDDFFFHRVTAHAIDTTRLQAHEVAQITGHRWWAVDELAATTESVYPFGLVPLLRELLTGRVPPEPLRLPWHH